MGVAIGRRSIMKLVAVAGLLLLAGTTLVTVAQQVPCYFIFGDSLVDNGNNNHLASLARADYRPYGIDLPQGPTGRFSNALTTIDVISQLLGFPEFIPPFVSTNPQTLLRGANFASAAAGIREETGQQLGGRITMSGQVENYRSAVSSIVNVLGDQDSTANHLSKCIFSIGLGGNDYLNNYFMPDIYQTGQQFTPEQYADNLAQTYAQHLTTLYNFGARKVALIGVGPVGCSPNVLSRFSSDGATCVEKINNAVQIFNSRLIQLVDHFNHNFAGAHFTFVNAFHIFADMLQRPTQFGFSVSNVGCCGVGRNNGQITCLPLQMPCMNRDDYLFWDAFHPSSAANLIIGRRTYSAESPSDSYPMDLKRLAEI